MNREGTLQRLACVLNSVAANETRYRERYTLVLEAMYLADQAGIDVGFRIDPKEPEWPVAFIDLPTGQVSWHMPQFRDEWDGHTTDEKHHRIFRFIEFAFRRNKRELTAPQG